MLLRVLLFSVLVCPPSVGPFPLVLCIYSRTGSSLMCVYRGACVPQSGVDIVELEDWQQRAPVPADWTRHLNWMLVRRALFYHQTFCHTFCPWDSVTHQSRPGTAYALSEAAIEPSMATPTVGEDPKSNERARALRKQSRSISSANCTRYSCVLNGPR